MGNKLLLDPDDPFLQPAKVTMAGIAGSCYCCNQQIHIPFRYMDELPLAKINKEHYYIFICDQCEDDIQTLNDAGVTNVSYDLLWAIQEPLEQDLLYLEENSGISSIENRNKLLISLYKEMKTKLDETRRDRYSTTGEDSNEDERKNKGNS